MAITKRGMAGDRVGGVGRLLSPFLSRSTVYGAVRSVPRYLVSDYRGQVCINFTEEHHSQFFDNVVAKRN